MNAPDGPPRHGTAVIIGPGAHFGSELLAAFASACQTVVLVARTAASLDALSRHAPLGVDVRSVLADVTAPAEFDTTLRRALADLPPLRYMIYNVKHSPKGPALDVAVDQFTEALEANVSGALQAVQLAASVSREVPTVCVLTGGGFKDRPDDSRLALSVSKASVHSLARALAPALRSRGVVVKTLVIDGVVRADGPIIPEDVAASMLSLAADPNRLVDRITAIPDVVRLQLALFDVGRLTA